MNEIISLYKPIARHARNLEGLTLEDVCDFIFDARGLRPEGKQLLILHIDETQAFLYDAEDLAFFKKLLHAIYSMTLGPRYTTPLHHNIS